eukprot:1404782-Rhodomonas_salina.1
MAGLDALRDDDHTFGQQRRHHDRHRRQPFLDRLCVPVPLPPSSAPPSSLGAVAVSVAVAVAVAVS